jgi:hypothetical protein
MEQKFNVERLYRERLRARLGQWLTEPRSPQLAASIIIARDGSLARSS